MKIYIIALLSLILYVHSSPAGIPLKWTGNVLSSTIWEPTLTSKLSQRWPLHMKLMMQGEGQVPNTDDVFVNFARQMIPHHWAAIVMALDTVNLGSNDSVITPIAQAIVISQTTQTVEFKTWLANQGIPWIGPNNWTYKQNPNDTKFNTNDTNSSFVAINAGMDTGMMGTPLTADPNKDLARQMIPHHWGAIQMAGLVLNSSCDATITAIAQNVNMTQTEQIVEFKAWLATKGWAWQGNDTNPNPLPNGTNSTTTTTAAPAPTPTLTPTPTPTPLMTQQKLKPKRGMTSH